MTVQFNQRIRPETAKKIGADARRENLPVGKITDAILSEFFSSFTLTERQRVYTAALRKTGKAAA